MKTARGKGHKAAGRPRVRVAPREERIKSEKKIYICIQNNKNTAQIASSAGERKRTSATNVTAAAEFRAVGGTIYIGNDALRIYAHTFSRQGLRETQFRSLETNTYTYTYTTHVQDRLGLANRMPRTSRRAAPNNLFRSILNVERTAN